MVMEPVAETKEASCGRGVVAGGSGAATLTAVATKQLPLGLVPVTATTCPGNSLKEGTCSDQDTTAIICHQIYRIVAVHVGEDLSSIKVPGERREFEEFFRVQEQGCFVERVAPVALAKYGLKL